ncbi:hypothetical protein ACP70R_019322 [Stipagrostis hirtigluma subsp. patula]
MALEAVVHPQPQGHFTYALPWCDTDTVSFGDGGGWDPLLLASLVQNAEWEEVGCEASLEHEVASAVSPPPVIQQQAAVMRRKRRRAKVVKNEEEIESQRITHIAVERNRRRQMNDYLAVLRSLMPPSYAQRGDQASIVGGAINYVRELEQVHQSLEAQKRLKEHITNSDDGAAHQSPFAGFFSYPQYSTISATHGGGGDNAHTIKAESSAAGADIEASMVEGHASVKVQAPRRPRQLLRLAAGLQQLGLTTLHLNVTTAGAMVMYSFSLKVEDECKLSAVKEIAGAVHEIIGRVQEEAGFS